MKKDNSLISRGADLIRRHYVVLVLIAITLIVLMPFKMGYYFAIDWVPVPGSYYINKFSLGGDSIIVGLRSLLNFLLGEMIVQKIIMFLIVFLLGLGGYKFAKQITDEKIAHYFSGFLAIFNPFVYDRFLDGHSFLLLGIAFFLWGSTYFLKYLESQTNKDAIKTGLLFGFSIAFSNHIIFFFGLLFALSLFIYPIKRKVSVGKIIKQWGVIIAFAILPNINWIIGQLFFNGDRASFVRDKIINADFVTFSSRSGDFGVYFNALSLHGYWGEAEGRFAPSTFLLRNWEIIVFILLIIIGFGIYYGIKNKEERRKSILFLVMMIASYILAIGIASPHFGAVTEWMYKAVPFYKGLREPQKWVGILLICYLYFSSIGIRHILKLKFIRKARKWWGVALCLLPIIYTSSMLFGFMGQLNVSDYPDDWYKANAEFFPKEKNSISESCKAKESGASEECYSTLTLPWHQYIGFKFSRKIIVNPIEQFFHNTKVLQGDNIEIANIYTNSNRPESKIIERYVGPGTKKEQIKTVEFTNTLKDLGIKNILVAKETDWKDYDNHLGLNPDLDLVWESENLIIYKISSSDE